MPFVGMKISDTCTAGNLERLSSTEAVVFWKCVQNNLHRWYVSCMSMDIFKDNTKNGTTNTFFHTTCQVDYNTLLSEEPVNTD